MAQALLAVPAEEITGRLAFYENAAEHRVVGIQHDDGMRTVLISLAEYERLKRRDREVIRTEDLDDETLAAILAAEPGERSKAAGRRLADPAAG